MSPSKEVEETPEVVQGAMVTPLMSAAARLPSELDGLINLSAWAECLINGKKYNEPDPDYLSRTLLTQTLMAETPEDVFNVNDLDGLQKLIPNGPGLGTGPVEINGLYVAHSSLNDKNATYMIMDITDLETGNITKTTTGAGQLQAQIMRLLGFGIWPIRCQIKRTERKDRGGRYLFWLFPVD